MHLRVDCMFCTVYGRVTVCPEKVKSGAEKQEIFIVLFISLFQRNMIAILRELWFRNNVFKVVPSSCDTPLKVIPKVFHCPPSYFL